MAHMSYNFECKRILITGGLGFIGSNLAIRLVDLGADVTIIDSLIPEYGGNECNIESIRNKVRVNISDVRDQYSIERLLAGQDYLFNLAGQTSHMDSMVDPFTDMEINVRAQISLLEACRKCNPNIRIVFASTRQIYGKPDYLPVDEEHLLRPVDANGINKMAGEWYHILYNNVYGIRSTALRLTNTFGPRMRIKDTRQTFLGIWIRKILEGEPIEVWGGDQLRDFTYVDDCVEALLLAASNTSAEGQIFNLGGNPVLSLKELADLAVKGVGSGRYIIKEFPQDRKKIDIGGYYSDFSKINGTLGWEPQITLSKGLKITFDYYRSNLDAYL